MFLNFFKTSKLNEIRFVTCWSNHLLWKKHCKYIIINMKSNIWNYRKWNNLKWNIWLIWSNYFVSLSKQSISSSFSQYIKYSRFMISFPIISIKHARNYLVKKLREKESCWKIWLQQTSSFVNITSKFKNSWIIYTKKRRY